MVKKNIFISIFILTFLFLSSNIPAIAAAKETAELENLTIYEKARVIEVLNLDTHEYQEEQFVQEQMVKVEILTGKFKGQKTEARNTISGFDKKNINVEPGDKVILSINEKEDSIHEAYLIDMSRTSFINYIVLAFIILLILIGRIKGIKYLIVLGVTIIALFKFLLPAIMMGHPPIRITVLVMSIVVLVTIIIISGLTGKSLAAIFGSAGGIIIAGLLATAAGEWAHLTGLTSEAGRMLLYMKDMEIDIQGFLVSGIIISAVGAIINVSISITTAVGEAKKAYPNASIVRMITTGMNAGRNIMGTMVNTLILGYAGGALPFILLYMAYTPPGMSIFNWELIAIEVVRTVVGSIGLIFSVPITAFFAGVMVKQDN